MEYDIFHIAANCDKAKQILETIATKHRDTPLDSSVSDIVKNIFPEAEPVPNSRFLKHWERNVKRYK